MAVDGVSRRDLLGLAAVSIAAEVPLLAGATPPPANAATPSTAPTPGGVTAATAAAPRVPVDRGFIRLAEGRAHYRCAVR